MKRDDFGEAIQDDERIALGANAGSGVMMQQKVERVDLNALFWEREF